MLKRFFRDSAIYGASSLLSRGLSLLLVPLFTRVLTPHDYGVVDMLTVAAAVVNLTIALEISQGVARFFGEARDRESQRSYASTALWFTVAVYSAFAIAALIFAGPLSAMLLESDRFRDAVRVWTLVIWGNGIFYLLQNQLRWELQPKLHAFASLTYTTVSLALSVLLVLVLRMGVIGVFLAQLAGTIGGGGVALYFARGTYAFRFDSERWWQMVRFSLPLVPSGLGVFVSLYIDRIAIQRLMTLHDVGLFGVGYRLAATVGLLMVGFQGALTPLIYANHQRPEAAAELGTIFRYFAALALLATLTLALFAREILVVFTTPAYYEAASVVPWLAAAVLLSNMYIFAPGMSIQRKTGAIALLNIGGAALNTLLNFTFVPLWGIRGAASATFLSGSLTFLGYMIVSQRLYYVPHAWRRLGTAAVITAALCWVGLNAGALSWSAVLVKLLLLGLASGLLVAFGVVRGTEVRALATSLQGPAAAWWRRARTG